MRGSLDLGSTFAGYLIMSRLGRGGMSVVYLAEQVGLGRKVALKILAPELADDSRFRERFARESKLAASIDHPNVIPIYEAGENDEVLYIAMRFVDGIDLKGLLHQEGHLDAHRAVTIVGQVARALDAAHQRGLAHRDVKPANILVVPGSPSSGPDHVYLADFGLTKHSTSHSSLTMTGQFVGTIDYIAPEQIEGKHVDGRVDIYALGCVLYECLTGIPPFQKESDIAVIYAHLRDEPPLVTARRPDLPAAIDAVVAKAMAKDPGDRYQTGAALAAAATVALSAPVVAPTPIAASPTLETAALEATRVMARPEAAPTVQAAPPVAPPTVQAAPPVAPTVQAMPLVAATVQAAPPLAGTAPVSGSGHQTPTAAASRAWEPSAPAALREPVRLALPPPPLKPRRRRRRGLVAGVVAVGAVAAAVAIGLLQLRSGDHTSGATGGSATSATSSTSASSLQPPGTLVFTDDFANPQSGWAADPGQADGGTAAYQAGSYFVTVLKPEPELNTFSLASPYMQLLSSMVVTVVAAIETGAPPDGAGVRCDHVGRSGLRYSFEVHADGTWVVFKIDDHGPTMLSQGTSAAIHVGHGQNLIQGQCTEVAGATRLTMTVNNTLLGSATDVHAAPIMWHGALVTYRNAQSPGTAVRFTQFRTYRADAGGS